MASSANMKNLRQYTHEILKYFSETLLNNLVSKGLNKKRLQSIKNVIKIGIKYDAIGKYNTVILNELSIILENIKEINQLVNTNNNSSRASKVITELNKIKKLYSKLKSQNRKALSNLQSNALNTHKAEMKHLKIRLRRLQGLSNEEPNINNLERRLLNLQLSPPTTEPVINSTKTRKNTTRSVSSAKRTKTFRQQSNRSHQLQSLFSSPFLDLPKTFEQFNQIPFYDFDLKLAEAKTIVDKLLKSLKGVQNKVNSTKTLSSKNNTSTMLNAELTKLITAVEQFNTNKTKTNYNKILTVSNNFNRLLQATTTRGLRLTRTTRFTKRH